MVRCDAISELGVGRQVKKVSADARTVGSIVLKSDGRWELDF